MSRGPLLIDLDDPLPPGPEQAPAVPDVVPAGAAMGRALALAAPGRGPGLGTIALAALGSFAAFVAGLVLWDWGVGLIARSPLLGGIAAALALAATLALVALALRELAGLARIGRLDRLQRAAAAALLAGDRRQATRIAGQVMDLSRDRPELAPARDRLTARLPEAPDAEAVLALIETDLLPAMDRAAEDEVARAARQVAAVTALVPLAFADVLGAQVANLRMIRRIAAIYGGRAGGLAGWRLARAVIGHVVATGAVAIGDDLIGGTLGGSVLSRLSRRFGEGVVNGALTVRVGLAAIDLCRPLPYRAVPRPRATALLGRALRGLFAEDQGAGG
jgi:putative membrane protein